jgi:anti-anti-sigma factor
MSLYIEQAQMGNVAVLQCAGRLVSNDALDSLKDAVTGLSQARIIVLDLSEVAIIGAHGLGMLVFLHKWACVNDIQLKLVNPSRAVMEILRFTGLASVLHVSSVNDVIQMFCNSDGAVENVERAAA